MRTPMLVETLRRVPKAVALVLLLCPTRPSIPTTVHPRAIPAHCKLLLSQAPSLSFAV